jgi:hypothetical protein
MLLRSLQQTRLPRRVGGLREMSPVASHCNASFWQSVRPAVPGRLILQGWTESEPRGFQSACGKIVAFSKGERMTIITLEVPDDLAAQFKLEPTALSALIREALIAKLHKQNGRPETSTIKPLHQELIDFLSFGPSLERIIKFKISAPAQERLEELLDKNREEQLTAEEKTELDQYMQYRHVLILLKASARRAIGARLQ